MDRIKHLDKLEAQIETAERNAYWVRGKALAAVRDDQLWRVRHNVATFEEYCDARWELAKGHVYRLIDAAAFADKVSNWRLLVPSCESHIRPLLERLKSDDDRIAAWRDVLATTNGKIRASDVDNAIGRFLAVPAPSPDPPMTMLMTHVGEEVPYKLPKGKATFNATNEQISWARWTWNPVTGCLRDCEFGCYARELANRASYAHTYPRGFAPIFHPERLDAPANTKVPGEAESDPRLKRVFVCSMGDLYGKWVPDEWIQRVHASCIASPQWDYLLLTKYPRRYVRLTLPPTAWVGTSVHEQKLVRLAEDAFRQIIGVRIKWLSLEPLMEPLQFTDLSMFDWVVIGSLSATEQPEGHHKEFAPPFEWVARIVAQAREAGCRVYLKPNLLGADPNPQSPGMQMPQEEPDFDARSN